MLHAVVRALAAAPDSLLSGVREDSLSVEFLLRVSRSAEGSSKAAVDARRIVARALEHGGSFNLSYLACTAREPLEVGYPSMPEFLRLKREFDPAERFQSSWYRHLRNLYNGSP
jgi:hypothetical protein